VAKVLGPIAKPKTILFTRPRWPNAEMMIELSERAAATR
jgi:hypothetical protein